MENFLRILFCIIYFSSITSNAKVLSDSNPTIEKDYLCNKTYFIEEYVKKGKDLSKTETLYLQTHCKVSLCVGTEYIQFVYAVNKNEYYFLITSAADILSPQNAGCWGFALEVFHINGSHTTYFNFFNNKSETLRSDVKITLGSTYSFLITPLPSGQQQEQMLITAPSICENKVLDYMYEKGEQNDWFDYCPDKADFFSRQKIASKVCAASETTGQDLHNLTEKHIQWVNCTFYFNGTTMSFFPRKSTIGKVNTNALLLTFTTFLVKVLIFT